MKRIILVIVAIISLVACNQTKEKKTDLQEANLKGKVKSVRNISYEAIEKFGEIDKGDLDNSQEYPISESFFNEQGMKIEMTLIEQDGDSEQWIYKYDNNSNQIELSIKPKKNIKDKGLFKSIEAAEEFFNLPSKFIFEYDKGNRVSKTLYMGDELKGKDTYKYDAQSNLIEENVYNSEGNIDSKTIYKYDNKNLVLVDKQKYFPDGSLDEKTISKYDGKDNKIEETTFDRNGKTKLKELFKYDEKGNEIEKKAYIQDLFFGRAVREYDKNDNITNLKAYDNKGQLITEYIFEYQYDSKNNWTKKMEYKDNKPKTITEREIEYYK